MPGNTFFMDKKRFMNMMMMMMMTMMTINHLSLLIAVILVAVDGRVASVTDDDIRWISFKSKYGKSYDSTENTRRRAIWEENHRRISAHNDLFAYKKTAYYLGENSFADWEASEFFQKMNGQIIGTAPGPYLSETVADSGLTFNNLTLPPEVNWVTKGYVTEVKRQDNCNAGWAFSATGAIEGAHFKKTGRLVSLSEKNLMDCSWKYGNQGCNGGSVQKAFQYVVDNKGINTEHSYPYAPSNDVTCHFNGSSIGATIDGYRSVSFGSELELQRATATLGPVSVSIDADHFSFMVYEGGVYEEPRCDGRYLSHAMVVVGYGTVGGPGGGTDYWLLKNSYGPSWGENGYMKMKRNNNNQCGIASRAVYP